MSAYLILCLAVLAIAGGVMWFFRPKKCPECKGTGKRICHDGAESDFHYGPCDKCKGTGWKIQ